MYRYYANAEVCYAYPGDVSSIDHQGDILECKWLTRGWTLQELSTPSNLVFFSMNWVRIGTKKALAFSLARIIGISEGTLRDSSLLQHESVAIKMSGASRRTTMREEDIAYCMLDIFNVNMPMLYGEGRRAFIRLQETIMKESTDQSLFAWTPFVAFLKRLAQH